MQLIKKAKNLLFFPALASVLFSCASADTTTSEWVGLEGAERVSCEDWPTLEKAISVKSIYPIAGKSQAFIAAYQMRSGSTGYFFHKFNGELELNGEDAEFRSFGEGAVFAGSGLFDGKDVIAILQNASDKAKLELRTTEDNVVRFSVPLAIKNISSPKVTINGRDIWLSYKEASDDVSAEDAKVGFMLLQAKKDNKYSIEASYQGLPVGSEIVAVNDGDVFGLLVWEDKVELHQKNAKFFVQAMKRKQKKLLGTALPLDVPVEDGVESWSLSAIKSGFLMSIVDGDSLVGQANLRVARAYWMDGYIKVSWAKSRSLLNEHVSDGLWLGAGAKNYFLMPKWLDKESTIGLYTINDTEIENVKPVGVFPSSVRLISAFWGKGKHQVFALARYKQKGANRFQLCSIGKP